jgi:predicted transcriptional regulator of viral defense system
MGKEKYLSEVMEFFKKTPVVSTRDIKLIINKNITRKNYTHLLVHNLIKSGRIKKVVKGFYTIHDDPTVAVFCFKPAYIGLQDALSLHNLWEQESNAVIITAKKVRSGIRRILDSNVVVHRINPRYLFGSELIKYGEFYVPVSDVEKTLIDFVYFKEPLDKEVLKEIKRKVDKKKINNYLKRYPERIRKSVLRLLEKSLVA